MPFTLPNGLVICNVTPHPLTMAFGQDVYEVPVDKIINAKAVNVTVHNSGLYRLVSVNFVQTDEGNETIAYLKKKYPGAILLGSVIAAKAYPGRIYSPVRLDSARYDKGNYIISSQRFTTF